MLPTTWMLDDVSVTGSIARLKVTVIAVFADTLVALFLGVVAATPGGPSTASVSRYPPRPWSAPAVITT